MVNLAQQPIWKPDSPAGFDDIAIGEPGDAGLHAARAKADETVGGKGGAALGMLAARQMSVADGARIGMIETNGWDTHTGQNYRLAAQLKQLVAGAMAQHFGLDPVRAAGVLFPKTRPTAIAQRLVIA